MSSRSRSMLIVGKNAKLVRAIAPQLRPHDEISHADLAVTDWSRYDDVFVFSWNFRADRANLEFLSRIPGEKTVLVSTAAVLALDARPQWNVYPRAKRAAEEEVLRRGGKVVRVGVTSRKLLGRLLGTVPFTSLEALACVINDWDGSTPRIVDAFVLERGRVHGTARFLARAFRSLSWLLPATAAFQAPLQLCAKLLGVRHAGYTADMAMRCCGEALIGYGALGSTYDRSRPTGDRTILVSGRPNEILESNGFVHTVIGHQKIGLAALWHGVGMEPCADHPGKARKRVPLVVPRPSPPGSRTVLLHVIRIRFDDRWEHWRITGLDASGAERSIRAQRVVLAAGPIENARILMPPASSCRFSDHEIAMIGSCTSEQAAAAQGVRQIGPLLVRRFSHVHQGPGRPFVLEFRPYVRSKLGHGSRDARFYLTSTRGVLTRLVRDLSWSRLNEAIFNRTGIAIDTGRCSVFVQAVCRNAIHLERRADGRDSLHRLRLTERDWGEVIASAREAVPELKACERVVSVDAQHVMGGAELLRDVELRRLISAGRIAIAGSPTDQELSAVHHTPGMQQAVARLGGGLSS